MTKKVMTKNIYDKKKEALSNYSYLNKENPFWDVLVDA